MLITLIEFGIVFKKEADSSDNSTLEIAFLDDKPFEQLKAWVVNFQLASVLAKYEFRKGKEAIRFQNYVGLLPINEHLVFEILPKNTTNNLVEARQTFLQLLQSLPTFSFKQTLPSAISVGKFPLLDCFVTLFLTEVETIIKKGLVGDYIELDVEATFIQGKINSTKQLFKKSFFDGKLIQQISSYSVNNQYNQLVKNALLSLKYQTKSPYLQARIRNILTHFTEIQGNSISSIGTIPKKFLHYSNVVWWATTFLKGLSPAVWHGQNYQWALVFPMEKLFESYLAIGFKKFTTDFQLQLQHSGKNLFINQLNQQHRLQPDIILQNKQTTIVIDAKWKLLDITLPSHNIHRSDLYQLYTYAKKYNAQRVLLIYPKSASFLADLPPFHFDEATQLRVISFDLTQPLSKEIQKILTKHIHETE